MAFVNGTTVHPIVIAKIIKRAFIGDKVQIRVVEGCIFSVPQIPD